jgi:hypothetical protein
MTTEIELNELLDQLKDARDKHEQAKINKDALIERLQATEEWKLAYADYSNVSTRVETLETMIRDATLDMYIHNSAESLPTRVSIRNFSVVNILDTRKAFDWCLKNFTPALKLDTKTFEKAAKDGNVPEELATVTLDPRPQIAAKL